MLNCEIEPVDNSDGVRTRIAAAAEGADRDNAGARCDTLKLSVRRDGAGHAGTVSIRRARAAAGIVTSGDRTGEIGLVEVDLGIDHRNDDLVAGSDAVSIGELEFVDDVLGWIALIGIRSVLILGRLILSRLILGCLILRSLILGQSKQVIGLYRSVHARGTQPRGSPAVRFAR